MQKSSIQKGSDQNAEQQANDTHNLIDFETEVEEELDEFVKKRLAQTTHNQESNLEANNSNFSNNQESRVDTRQKLQPYPFPCGAGPAYAFSA